jgi:hypothetical protein
MHRLWRKPLKAGTYTIDHLSRSDDLSDPILDSFDRVHGACRMPAECLT